MTQDRLDKLFRITSNDGLDDITYDKQLILQDLYKDGDILETLHNPDLDITQPEEFRNVNIFSFLKVPDTQTTVKNFICFEVNDTESMSSNNLMVSKEITFMTICHSDEVQTAWGIDRQDLLAFLIKDRFQWSNYFGMQLKKTYDIAGVFDKDYYCRTLRFQAINTSSLQKAKSINLLDRNRKKYETGI